ncbi:MAG: ComEC/Rec2 family competence protein [Cyanobacteria bacterium P01_C01_bin.121]
MVHWGALVIIGAYIVGLFATGITDAQMMGSVSLAGLGLLTIGVASSLSISRFWRIGPTRRQWWIAGIVGLVAASYCIARTPHPAANDISRFAGGQEKRVLGTVIQMPQTSRSGKGQFFLKAQSVRGSGNQNSIEAPRRISGKLYVSAPLWPSQKLYPGELIEMRGRIEAVDQETNGFGEYLARKGCFASFKANWVEFLPDQKPPRWALWKLRARIVAAQDRWLGEPAGNLLSAMTLGRKAVNLPYDIRDSFIDAGLAHTLAASGFHVSLLLALILGSLRTRSSKIQAAGGGLALLFYVGLTGLQPSVVRASVMGLGAMIGLATEQKVKPLGGLLMAAVLILLFNPTWVWNVGFQLSVVATLGLILTVSRLIKYLDWMPTTVATLLAVPIAAYLWTIPLQLLYFQRLPVYSIFLNMLATPLVIAISLGGFVSVIAAIFVPVVGSAIASGLYYPIHLLIWLVDRFNQLPFNSIELTGVQGWHVALSYGVYAVICIWLWKRGKPPETAEPTAFLL